MRYLRKPIFVLLLIFSVCYAHAQSPVYAAKLKTLHGTMVPFSSAMQKDSLILVCFWSTSSDMSINELNAINAEYEKWKGAVSFRLIAVSVDEGKDANKVRPTANMNEWKFDVYTDIDGDLRKALDSNNLPQAMIIKKDKVIYQQSGYEPGSEKYLFEKIKIIAAGRS